MPEVIAERFVFHEHILRQLLGFITTNMTLGF